MTCPVWIYPIDGFLIASDRQLRPDAEGSAELVFPAHNSGTLNLLKLLPGACAGDALDLCAGTGIGALHLARAGTNATSLDITARAAHFADFNAQLNGLRIESLRGDLFAPVEGRAFDLICAHPPWVPSLGDGAVFREGGDIGEELLARLAADLPRHLQPGGTAILMCMGRDGRDASFEQRLRSWLGEAGATFDIMVGVMRTMSIDELPAHCKGFTSRATGTRPNAWLNASGTFKREVHVRSDLHSADSNTGQRTAAAAPNGGHRNECRLRAHPGLADISSHPGLCRLVVSHKAAPAVWPDDDDATRCPRRSHGAR